MTQDSLAHPRTVPSSGRVVRTCARRQAGLHAARRYAPTSDAYVHHSRALSQSARASGLRSTARLRSSSTRKAAYLDRRGNWNRDWGPHPGDSRRHAHHPTHRRRGVSRALLGGGDPRRVRHPTGAVFRTSLRINMQQRHHSTNELPCSRATRQESPGDRTGRSSGRFPLIRFRLPPAVPSTHKPVQRHRAPRQRTALLW